MKAHDVVVVGGGLAGCEAAWQLAERGLRVALLDMKPVSMSPAHQTPLLCELVCSNSLRSNDPNAPAGLLKRELREAGSLVIRCADEYAVPAGSALAVERFGFGREVTRALVTHPNIDLQRRALDELPDVPTVLATGPLTGGALARTIARHMGGDRLYFYDAIAPIVSAESLDSDHCFRASRWGKSEQKESPDGDYINCVVPEDIYRAFVSEILAARKVVPRSFEEPRFFEGCLPIEVMAERGEDVLRYGPMRPVGLFDPKTGRRPYAVVQLRAENRYATAYNLVGFQTRMAYPEQKRIFSMIPALRNAEFLRMGSIHRNTYVDSPRLLGDAFELRDQPNVHLAGLITGVEGYIESCAIGLLVGLFVAHKSCGRALVPPPETTALGGLYHHVRRPREKKEAFSPTNINFGLLPALGVRAKKAERKAIKSRRAGEDFAPWCREYVFDELARGQHAAAKTGAFG